MARCHISSHNRISEGKGFINIQNINSKQHVQVSIPQNPTVFVKMQLSYPQSDIKKSCFTLALIRLLIFLVQMPACRAM